ncbi:MAG TPA: hypothetical protein VFO77_01610 [Actinoplanes sp.]|nr:hypothetical protein [Actinoplanes sp.]
MFTQVVYAHPQPPEQPRSPAQQHRRQLLVFGGVAGVIVAVGMAVVLAVAFSGDNPFGDRAAAPTDVRPPLAKACPAPTGQVSAAPRLRPPSAGAPKPGARTVDEQAGISYAAYPAPWEPWTTTWRAGTLEVPYRTGQHFVTEIYSGGTYHASILSAAVPAADNDALTLDLDCVGRQIAADVRAEYYPQPNTMDAITDETTTIGGRPAWLSTFRLHFSAPDLKATSELSAVAVIDVGRPTAAVLYVSIPNTHQQLEYVVAEVLASVRPL